MTKCLYCFDNFPEAEITALDDCEHFLCTGCMHTYIQFEINNGNCAHLKCFHRGLDQNDCHRMITDAEVERIMPREVFADYTKRMAILNLVKAGRLHCPNPDIKGGCGAMVMPDGKHSRTTCQQCSYVFCSNPACKVQDANGILGLAPWHNRKSCEAWQEEVMRKGMRAIGSKQCPGIIGKDAFGQNIRCKAMVQKNEGCNHMTCTTCKHDWCWTCQHPHKKTLRPTPAPNAMGACLGCNSSTCFTAGRHVWGHQVGRAIAPVAAPARGYGNGRYGRDFDGSPFSYWSDDSIGSW